MAFSISLKRKSWSNERTPPNNNGFPYRNTLLQTTKRKKCLESMEIKIFEHLKTSNLTFQNQRVRTVPFLATPTIVVNLIFLICRQLNQPPEVRYLAVELFDRFSYQHFKDLSIKVWTNNAEEPKYYWDELMKRIESQHLLRLLSCVEIASKFIISDDKIIRGRAVQEFLREAKQMYTLKSIMSSEFRVLRTLGFKVHVPTTLLYVDALLKLLKVNEGLSQSTLDEICVSVIDIAYLHHQEIYHKLHYISTGCWEKTEKERLNFLPVECNKMFLASAVILTAVNIVLPDQQEISTDICKQLDQLTDIPSGDILGLAAIIMERIIIT